MDESNRAPAPHHKAKYGTVAIAIDPEIREIIRADQVKKWRTCLSCGKKMWTTRGTRICEKCRRNSGFTDLGNIPYQVPHRIHLPTYDERLDS